MSHKSMKTCASVFADAGNPWCTPEDWAREADLWRNPTVSERAQDSAADFTRRASIVPGRVKPKAHYEKRNLTQPETRDAKILRRAISIRAALARKYADPIPAPPAPAPRIWLDPSLTPQRHVEGPKTPDAASHALTLLKERNAMLKLAQERAPHRVPQLAVKVAEAVGRLWIAQTR